MNPFESIFRDMANMADKIRFAHLTKEQCVDLMMECNSAFWKHITFADADTVDIRGRNMQSLLLSMRDMDLAQYHRDHVLIDEDDALRRESELRCKFWYKFPAMLTAAIRYAEYCGYITIDYDALNKEEAEIEAKYEAMKPSTEEQPE